MNRQSKKPSLWGRCVLAIKQLALSKRIRYYETCEKHELLHARQAKANAQWYKVQAGILKYKLEDLQNAAK